MSYQTKRALIAEDSQTQAAMLRHTLEANGWEVGVALNGREALDMIERDPPDIIVSDARIPGMDGYSLCTAVKKSPNLKDIPFVLLTPADNPTDIIQGLRCGVNGVVLTPCEEDEFLSRLRYVLANAELRHNARVDIGVELHLDGQQHFLTPERFQVLDILVSSFQATVDKNEALEQRAAELASALHSVEKREKDYRALLDRDGDGVMVVDDQGLLRYANPAARSLLGPERTIAEPLRWQVPLESDGVVEIEVARDDLAPATVEVRKGDTEWEGMNARLVTLHDVTARKLALEQLERAQLEKLRVKDEFLAHVSHELRTPLGAIDQFVTIMLDGLAGPISDEQRRYLTIAHRNAAQLRSMIEDLLLVTCAQSGRLVVEPRELSLPAALGEAKETLEPTAAEKGVALALETAPELPRVYADPQRVRQIVLNLVGNALKFTPAGGTITVAAARQPENEAFLQISVRDTGCGIRAEDREPIFDQQYQAVSTREQNREGLGLGLFISRDLVARQGGRIWVESELERGTAVHFTLPVFGPDQVLWHSIRVGAAAAGKEGDELCVVLLTLDEEAASKVSSVRDGGKSTAGTQVWKALARKAEKLRLESAFSGNEFVVVAAVNSKAAGHVENQLRRLFKDILFKAAPGAECGFSCGVATPTAKIAVAPELLAAARKAQVHERVRIAAKYIVIADDDDDVRHMYRDALQHIGVKRIAEAAGGSKLLAMLAEEVPDLILLDLKMPDMNGYEVIGRLKEDGRTAEVPVLMVSGYEVRREDMPNRIRRTAIPVLAKPVELDVLTRYVSYLL